MNKRTKLLTAIASLVILACTIPLVLFFAGIFDRDKDPGEAPFELKGTYRFSHFYFNGATFKAEYFIFPSNVHDDVMITDAGYELLEYYIFEIICANTRNFAVYHHLSRIWLDWDNVDRIHAQFIQLLNFELGSLLPLTTQDRENALTQIPSIRDIKDFPIAQPMITEMQDMIQDIYTNNSWAQQSFMSDVIHERIARVFLQGRQEYLANLIGTPRFYEYLHIVIRNMLLSRIRPLRFGTEILLAYESTVHDEHGFFWINEQGEVIVSGRVEFYGTLPSFVICKETRTLTGETGDNTRIVFRQI